MRHAADAPLVATTERNLVLAGEQEFKQCIAKQIEPYSVPCQIELAPVEPAELDRRIAELHYGVLAISAGGEIRSERLRELFTRLACDIRVVA